jgi:hypothetical protein
MKKLGRKTTFFNQNILLMVHRVSMFFESLSLKIQSNSIQNFVSPPNFVPYSICGTAFAFNVACANY